MRKQLTLLEGSNPSELQSRLVFALAVGLAAGLIGLAGGLGAGAHRQAAALDQAFTGASAVCLAASEAGAEAAPGERRNGGRAAARQPEGQPIAADTARASAEPRVAAVEPPQARQNPPTYVRLREPEPEPADPMEGLRPGL